MKRKILKEKTSYHFLISSYWNIFISSQNAISIEVKIMKFFLGRAFYRENYKIIDVFFSWNCSYFLRHNYFTYSQQGTKLLFAIFNFFPWQSCDSICFTLVKCLELQSHHCFFWKIFRCGLNSMAGIMNVNMAYIHLSYLLYPKMRL